MPLLRQKTDRKNGMSAPFPIARPNDPSPPTLWNAPDFALALFMTVECDVEQEIGKAVEIPAGLRRKVRFKEADKAVSLTRGWSNWKTTDPDKKGTIRSGANWILIRTDGVMVLDSRITLGFPAKDGSATGEEYLIDATLKAVVDLKNSLGCTAREAYEEFTSGASSVSEHKLWGSVRFQAAERASVDLDTSWLPRHLQRTADRFGDFAPLTRQQFVASGAIEVRQAPYYPPKKITVRIWGAQERSQP